MWVNLDCYELVYQNHFLNEVLKKIHTFTENSSEWYLTKNIFESFGCSHVSVPSLSWRNYASVSTFYNLYTATGYPRPRELEPHALPQFWNGDIQF